MEDLDGWLRSLALSPRAGEASLGCAVGAQRQARPPHTTPADPPLATLRPCPGPAGREQLRPVHTQEVPLLLPSPPPRGHLGRNTVQAWLLCPKPPSHCLVCVGKDKGSRSPGCPSHPPSAWHLFLRHWVNRLSGQLPVLPGEGFLGCLSGTWLPGAVHSWPRSPPALSEPSSTWAVQAGPSFLPYSTWCLRKAPVSCV